MSKQMLCSFFPAHCSHIFEPFIPSIYELLYPDDVVESCPEQVLNGVFGMGISIRRPFLAVFALLGLSTGLLGALRIQSTLATGKSNAKNTFISHDPRFYWMIAFLSFGLMNLSGLFLHCLVPATGISALERPLFWVGDTYTTGAFGLALWAAAMMESVPSVAMMANWTTWDMIQSAWVLGSLMGTLAIGWFLVFRFDAESLFPGTLPLEMWYGGTATVLGSSALTLMLIRNFNWRLCLGFALSYVVYWVGMFDHVLCRRFGNMFMDLLTAPTLFFLATDIVYLGIALWLETRRDEHTQKTKQT